jgi:hypothetical protein
MGATTIPAGTTAPWVELATSSPTSGLTVSFTSIAEYANLRIEFLALATTSSTQPYRIRFNNDSGSSYSYNSGNSGSSNANATEIQTNGRFTQITIEDANGVSKRITGASSNGSLVAVWNSQSVIDRIDVLTIDGTVSYSSGTIKIYGRR